MSQINCPNCGKELQSAADTCPDCGHAIPAVEEKKPNNKKRNILIGVIAAIVLIVCIVLFSVCFHDWAAPTCTAPSTCTKCGKTQGDTLPHNFTEPTCTDPKICVDCKSTNGTALGHDWKDATCAEPQTCARCGKTEGAKLAHTASKWTTKTEPTCVKTGLKTAKCDNCGEPMEASIPMVAHTKGEWVVTAEATVTEKGTKSLSCTVCDEVLETESFSLSDEEIIAVLKKAPKINYNDSLRYPEKYEGTYGRFSGRVIQVISSWGTNYLLNTGSGNLVYVTDYNVGDRRVIEDDSITAYGVMDGTYTYTTVMGASKTVPKIVAYYIP